MTGQELTRVRLAAGLSRRELARRARLSESTIQRIEKDLAVPHHASQHLLLQTLLDLPREIEDELEEPLKEYQVNQVSMERYLRKPTNGWRTWTRYQRGSFRRWRLWYRRVLAEAQAGRAVVRFTTRPTRHVPPTPRHSQS